MRAASDAPDCTTRDCDHEMAVEVSEDFVRFDAHAQMVPFAAAIVFARDLFEDGPAVDAGALKARQAQLPGAGIKSVMLIRAVRGKNQAGGPGFIIQMHAHGNFIRPRRDGLNSV